MSFKTIYLFLQILFLCFACSKPKHLPYQGQVTIEDREWLEKFFKDILLDEHGIYTLWGSKPLTIVPVFNYSEEDYKAQYETLSNEEKKNSLPIYDYNLPENWARWEKIRDQFPLHRYVLFKKLIPDTPKEFFIYFADIAKIAFTLEKHYTLFKRLLNFEFDPLAEAFQLEKGSQFWDAIFSNSILVGILCGYGEQNAFFFHLAHNDNTNLPQGFRNSLNFHFSSDAAIKQNIHNLGIPTFASFSDLEDPVIDRYKQEQAAIKTLYKDKNFLDVTICKLTFSNQNN